MLAKASALAVLLAVAVASSAAASVRVAAPTYPCFWKSGYAVDSQQEIRFTFALKQRNLDQLAEIALAVSDPTSSKYGQYLTTEQIADLTAPRPEHMAAVIQWLEANKVAFSVRLHNVEVICTVAQAEALLDTTFALAKSEKYGQSKIHAGAYTLPAEIADAVETVFGLHGLPIPPRESVRSVGDVVAVTPAVIAQSYNVSGATVNRNGSNIQAVAEFQAQYMNKNDLVSFFKAEVPKAQTGDDQVAKFVGSPYVEGSSVEAALDIQFIMGVADGVATQFWEFPNNDFCNDLNVYTTELLTTADVPLVNSISYGWQGDLDQLSCQDKDLQAVDSNWAKLAAKGISVLISSGDSGSGFTEPQCDPSKPGEKGVEVTKGELQTTENAEAYECCAMAQQTGAPGWTWYPPSNAVQAKMAAPAPRALGFTDADYHCEVTEDAKYFKSRDVYILNGDVSVSGGKVKVHCPNGTIADTYIDFGAEYSGAGDEKLRNFTMSARAGLLKHAKFGGTALYLDGETTPLELRFTDPYTQELKAVFASGPNPPPPPPQGTCKIYKTVTATANVSSSIISGGSAVLPPSQLPTLFPSWPASSPWVTAVGATRFVGEAGSEQMASDQFGSGGGFSFRFSNANATWQQKVVAAYVAQGRSLANFPPANSFPATGRATPDVSGLGEGYQVYVNGEVEPVGGTSASCPMFAALISLINEERLAAGKPQMGYLNPFLYQNSDAFTDIVKGTNAIGRGGEQLKYGFAAAEGWDAATGLGTPIFSKLLPAAMAAARDL
ncbi:uncharacterized protein MONBRDRAFT_32487 [Monosiga brevicollis MX1]|uniref:Peptidase S53 domain-containing protein n=1 Tax=Monosiga brevicollis TaxID=81824 RepID=A9UZT8_MONBE|nr:uncharacterized protein MONBRDRAFT_32487 [Monosiga brevicollis MX1]EDQ89292.1 predicted protein [Monosiga brevicollis MX1]|eukprot:XP_001745868.1 hypothetical protein [Monosiga brevicollis MX1]